MVGTRASVSGSKAGILGPCAPCWRRPGAPGLGLEAVGGPGGTGGFGGCFPAPETNFVFNFIPDVLPVAAFFKTFQPILFSAITLSAVSDDIFQLTSVAQNWLHFWIFEARIERGRHAGGDH